MKFKYLGIQISGFGNVEYELREQPTEGLRKAACLNETIWRNKHIGIEPKSRIHKATIRPIMTYTAETRPETVKTVMETKLSSSVTEEPPLIFQPKVDITCPRSPPGPYYRPYSVDSCIIFHKECQKVCDEMRDERKMCMKPNYVSEISKWDPFERTSPMCSDVVEKWGKMVFRDFNHAHGGHCNLVPKKK